jgi:CRP-like cAMP-binding protein
MTLESDIGCLKCLPLFQALPKPRLKLVALMGEKLAFADGELLASEGEPPDGVFVLLEGEVELAHDAADGRSKRFLLTEGSIIGDVPMLCGRTYAGRVVAKGPVTALRLPKDLFFELLETVPDFAMALSRDLAARLYRLADFVLHKENPHKEPEKVH